MPRIDLRGKNPDKPNDKGTVKTTPVGEYASEGEITPQEKTILLGTGWKPGKPIPRPLLDAIRADMALGDAPIGAVGLSGPDKAVKFSELPANRQKELYKSANEMNKTGFEVKSIGGAIPPGLEGVLDPSIIAAMQAEQDMSVRTISTDPSKQRSQAPDSTPPKPASDSSAGGEQPVVNCPHCGHDLAKIEDPVASVEDKLSFVQAVLGGIRFTKEYELLDGQMRVVFRSLTTDEADTAFTQAALEVQKGSLVDEVSYMRTLTDYRLVMSIESITTPTGVIKIPEALSDDFVTDKPPKGQTKLHFIIPYVYSNVLKTESLRRAVGANFFRFQRLIEKLEARADDPGFWRATGQPR